MIFFPAQLTRYGIQGNNYLLFLRITLLILRMRKRTSELRMTCERINAEKPKKCRSS